jgi:hypothetical protein
MALSGRDISPSADAASNANRESFLTGTPPHPEEDTMRKLIISLAAAAAITAAAAPALAQPAHTHAPAHVAAIIWHPGTCPGCHNSG